MINIGEALKTQRELSKLTQLELAKRTGISQQNISRWEKNDVIPKVDFCVILADFYGISLDELIGRDIKPTPSRYISNSFNNNNGNINFK